ncbi:MAG TPA: PIG-L family deacetylase [Thermoanaerobaculia bacterium]|nr:PIG-L family deacetylase [Thermoanaerobaculia bacterium]
MPPILADPLLSANPPRTLVVAAHPDDETLGAGILISRLPERWVLHVTDGAPRDAAFISKMFSGSRAEYAAVRRRELEAAMTLAGLPPERLLVVPEIADQEASFSLSRLAREIAAVVRDIRPEVVLTHAYEGGHPDHDATAFAVHAASELLRAEGLEPPARLEMALYHATPCAIPPRLLCHEFLPAVSSSDPVRLALAPEEQALKQKMLSCFITQGATLAWFHPFRAETFRRAPAYDFTRAPHAGPLQYEIWGFALTGERWRKVAKSTMAELALGGVGYDRGSG